MKLTEPQQRFYELYVQEILISEGSMSAELLDLFDTVLEQFDGDPARMDTFIQQIITENTEHVPSETEILQRQVAQMAFNLMQIEGI